MQHCTHNLPLKRSIKADIAIIGGGFTGLSSAYHLIKRFPNKQIVLLEGAYCGYGASGRNGGFVEAHGLVGYGDIHNPEVLEKEITASLYGLEHIKRLISENGINSDFEESGNLMIEFLEEGINRPEPFLLFLSYNAPHFPLHAPKDITDKYAQVYEKGWDVIRAKRFNRLQSLGIGEPEWELPSRSEVMIERRDMGYGGKPNPAWESFTVERQKDLARRMAVYAAMVDRMDQNIGRVIGLLEESGELENTLIFFLSDNGACAEFNPLGFDISV